MSDSNSQINSKSVVKNLDDVQIESNADQALRSYRKTLHELFMLKPTKLLRHHSTAVDYPARKIQFNAKGNLLANSFWKLGTIQIWDWEQENFIKIFKTNWCNSVRKFDWAPCDDENLMVTAGLQGDIKLTNITTEVSERLLLPHIDEARGIMLPKGYTFTVTPNLPYTIYAGSYFGKVKRIDLRNANKVTELYDRKKGHLKNYEIQSIAINPEYCSEICLGGIDSVLTFDARYWKKPVREFSIIEPPTGGRCLRSQTDGKYIDHVEYNFNGTEIMAVTNTDPIYVIDSAGKNPLKKYSLNSDVPRVCNIYDAHFLGERSEFVVTISALNQSSNRSFTLFFWNTETKEIVRQLVLNDESWILAVHPKSTILGTNWYENGLRVWQ